MRGVVQRADLFAQRVDLAGPAGLVMFLAVLGEARALERRGQLGLQFGEVACGRCACRGRRGGLRLRRLVEQAIDAGDAAAQAVTAGEFFAQARAGEDGVLAAQFLDQGEDRCVREPGRAGHACQYISYGK